MLKQIRKKIAVITNVLLVLQIALLGATFNPSSVSAAEGNSGSLVPTNNANTGWTAAEGAYASDDVYASANAQGDLVDYIDFNIFVPAEATVAGIEVQVEGYTTSTRQIDLSISGDGGATFSSLKTTDLPVGSTEEVTTSYGDVNDLWGLALSPENFTNENFRLRLDATDVGSGPIVYVDHVNVIVHYTIPDLKPTITISPYNTELTNQDVVVNATTDAGTLNTTSYTFTENGFFDFIATNGTETTTERVTITNIDKIAPVIEVAAPAPVKVEKGITGSVVNYSVTATDNVDANLVVNCTPASGSMFFVGSTTVTCSTEDVAGNVETKSFDVTVYDKELPTVTTDLGGVIKNGSAKVFTLTVDNNYGLKVQDASALITFYNTKLSEIKSFNLCTTKNVPDCTLDLTEYLVQDDNDVVALIEGITIPEGLESSELYFSLAFNNELVNTDKNYFVNASLYDAEDNMLATIETKIVSDGTKPVVKMESTPASVNDAAKYTAVTFTANETIDLMLSLTGSFIKFKQGDVSVSVLPEKQTDPKVMTVLVPRDKFSGKEKIVVTTNFVDAVGNDLIFQSELIPDVIAPAAVGGFNFTIDGKNVVLKWENPTDQGSYESIIVVRDGNVIATLAKTTTTYTDQVSAAGTYSYQIKLVDAAGNETITTASVATVEEPKAVVNQPVQSNTELSQAPAEEVKAETTENKDEKSETKNQNNLPKWGIILLLVLVGIGGYLYLSDSKLLTKFAKKPVSKTKPKVTAKKK